MRLLFAITGDQPHAAEVCLGMPILGAEDRRTLKLKERVSQLFDELREPVYRYLLCLGLSSGAADEVVQESFLRLFEHLRAGGKDQNLRGWVFRVAHNLAVDTVTARVRLVETSPEEWARLNESLTAEQLNPEETLIEREKMSRLHRALQALSAQQRQCIFLRSEGFRYREIAQILGLKTFTVTEYLRRAVEKLKRDFHA